ncbi:MAG: hypothetical protein KJ808_00105 [Acidobacteria bacterium]|nr:hypothetical protein [Acidobacteriota bacterium]MBU4306257.1 hypothetical protein [Acidobacteriota bacterium]MBU4405244.1 hypothetical protein [Acidobacteriota bacterium]MCG2809968.1 hypothetical protein [Candidatus Aminicenantes bacterium]
MIKTIRFALLIFIFSMGFVLIGDQIPDPETDSTVPELIDFHDIIYPIWHTAFPAKDYNALRGFLPEIEAGMARINAAALPGILREKKQAWESGLAEFNWAVDAYKKAAAGSDDQALLDAAELLHMRFEMQVRAIRPVAREVDAYHKVLYVVYHKYLPEKKYAEIGNVAADMVAKAEAVTKATLSKRLAAKIEAFQAAAAKLLAETKALEAAGKAGLEKDIPQLVEKVHSAYQALEKVFN